MNTVQLFDNSTSIQTQFRTLNYPEIHIINVAFLNNKKEFTLTEDDIKQSQLENLCLCPYLPLK
jgi:hypothetical protein